MFGRCLLIAVCLAPVCAVQGNDSSSVPASTPADDSFSAIVTIRAGSDATHFGVLVSPDHVLTTATFARSLVQPTHAVVLVGGKSVSVHSVAIHPDFDATAADHLAIVRLGETIKGVSPVSINGESLDFGSQLTTVTTSSLVGESPRKSVGTTIIDFADETQAMWLAAATSETDVELGFVETNGSLSMATFPVSTESGLGMATSLRIDPYHEWIDSTIAATSVVASARPKRRIPTNGTRTGGIDFIYVLDFEWVDEFLPVDELKSIKLF